MKVPANRCVLAYEAPAVQPRRIQFGNVSTALAIIVLAIVAWVLAGAATHAAVANKVIFGAWLMSVASFGFGAAGIILDRHIRFSVIGSLLSILEIIFVICC
jgi:hypothetical protein